MRTQRAAEGSSARRVAQLTRRQNHTAEQLVAALDHFLRRPGLGQFNLETAVGRPPGCVRRGVWQGTTRRNSPSIPTSCNAARRRAARALVVVAALTRQVSLEFLQIHPQTNYFLATRSGQLRFLGVGRTLAALLRKSGYRPDFPLDLHGASMLRAPSGLARKSAPGGFVVK